LSTPSIGPRYGFPRLKIIISRNIYRIGTLIVIKTGHVTDLGLELTIYVIKSQSHSLVSLLN
jgi:hypothetical protein